MAATNVHEEPLLTPPPSDETLEASSGFIGQWRTLVSTTNWEKGQIICGWRDALKKSGAPVTDYSDDAWAQMVGDVTGQHVGRLRRTFDCFGQVYTEYHGLYWSHFQTALDWQDAEMWLEGALQNGWSISQMRAHRWEAVGDGKPEPDPADAADAADLNAALAESAPEPISEPEESAVLEPADPDHAAEPRRSGSVSEADASEDSYTAPAAERKEPVRPMKDLAELPEDLAEAFEQFKLAILTHKMTDWQEVSRDDVLASLHALEQLALAPSE